MTNCPLSEDEEAKYLDLVDEDIADEYLGESPHRGSRGAQHRPTGSMSAQHHRMEVNQFYAGTKQPKRKQSP